MRMIQEKGDEHLQCRTQGQEKTDLVAKIWERLKTAMSEMYVYPRDLVNLQQKYPNYNMLAIINGFPAVACDRL